MGHFVFARISLFHVAATAVAACTWRKESKYNHVILDLCSLASDHLKDKAKLQLLLEFS